ncbi:DUF262 domain-containing protein [Pseudomonas asiatica]|uniref:DUF262 domain-containing protein n=1 Tax=Pseudomonas asiatica TaxID=2219225 RepID=UPI001666BEE6|nr:DUF262 domain-containing protein [Pseudomonas asiatica]QNT38581.1 DUF262 domain-containing protein [Pseudomonas asiatica]
MNQAVSERSLAPQLPFDVEGIAVASTSLDNLFNGKRIPSSDGGVIFGRLHLPEYQRPYRWSEEQLGRLLDDLRSFFSSDAPAHDFYLGSIILHQEGATGASVVCSTSSTDSSESPAWPCCITCSTVRRARPS